MQEYMDSMQHYLGASCEVLKLNNNFLFAGSIHQYDAGEDELTVSIRNGNETPQGGMLETIRYNGGIDFIITRLTRHVTGKRGAELSIAALVSVANLCTANNTIAIITTGPIAKDIAKRFHLDRRKTASILDTFSCLIQGIIPYGAQMLIAAGLAGISPLSIIGNLYYPFCMGACAILAILIRYPKKYS